MRVIGGKTHTLSYNFLREKMKSKIISNSNSKPKIKKINIITITKKKHKPSPTLSIKLSKKADIRDLLKRNGTVAENPKMLVDGNCKCLNCEIKESAFNPQGINIYPRGYIKCQDQISSNSMTTANKTSPEEKDISSDIEQQIFERS